MNEQKQWHQDMCRPEKSSYIGNGEAVFQGFSKKQGNFLNTEKKEILSKKGLISDSLLSDNQFKQLLKERPLLKRGFAVQSNGATSILMVWIGKNMINS